MKVKIIFDISGGFERSINNFIKNKTVIDIKFNTLSNGMSKVLILYKDR